MTHQSPTPYPRIPVDAGRQVAQLRHVLQLVEELSGRKARLEGHHAALDESARVASAYENAMPIVQRRFDALAGEIATWSAAAVEALLSAGEGRSKAAANRLAEELAKALTDLTKLLRL